MKDKIYIVQTQELKTLLQQKIEDEIIVVPSTALTLAKECTIVVPTWHDDKRYILKVARTLEYLRKGNDEVVINFACLPDYSVEVLGSNILAPLSSSEIPHCVVAAVGKVVDIHVKDPGKGPHIAHYVTTLATLLFGELVHLSKKYKVDVEVMVDMLHNLQAFRDKDSGILMERLNVLSIHVNEFVNIITDKGSTMFPTDAFLEYVAASGIIANLELSDNMKPLHITHRHGELFDDSPIRLIEFGKLSVTVMELLNLSRLDPSELDADVAASYAEHKKVPVGSIQHFEKRVAEPEFRLWERILMDWREYAKEAVAVPDSPVKP